MRKELAFDFDCCNNYLGTIGDSLGNHLYVGDFVAVVWDGRIIANVLCKTQFGNGYMMGLGGTDLKKLISNNQLTKIFNYNQLTQEILDSTGCNVTIKEAVIKKMTQAEIEKQLGYTIEIIKENS